MYVCMYVCLIPPGWNPAKSGAAPRATTKKPSPTWNNQLRLGTTAVDGAPLRYLLYFKLNILRQIMIWTSIQLGYLHFTVYNLSYHAYIHYLLFHALLPVILRYSLAQGRVASKSAIRVTVHRSSSVSLIDSQIATRSPRVHGSTGPRPRLQFGNKNRNSTFMYYIQVYDYYW